MKRMATGILAGLGLAWGLPGLALGAPAYQEVKAHYRASDILVLDRAGQPLDRVRTDFESRRGEWVPLEDISVALQQAVILSEDRRFYDHAGVDWQAVAAAAWGNLAHAQHRGASTLSMQLLGLIDQEYGRGPHGRSIMQKIEQAFEARRLEAQWSKPHILEAYLNLAAFRGELVGVDALSHVLFQKHPSGLNARESALAAVLLRAPNARHPVVVQRACQVLVQMGSPQECKGLSDFVALALLRSAGPWAGSRQWAPHYARLAIEQGPAHAGSPEQQSVRSTLDAALQRYAAHSVARHVKELGMASVRDAAVVVLDNRSGQVLAYVGSSEDLSAAPRVDHARALRQAGSTLKPFLYAQAIEQERLTAVSLLNDGPLNLPTGNGLYIPQNYDKHFAGWVSVRTALASSLNIPAVRALLMVTPDAFARRLVRLGVPLDQSGDFYGYSLALGSADVTLLSLTNAYRALANLGRYSPPRFSDTPAAQGQAQQLMPPGAAWIIGDILSDRQARARTFGLDSVLSTPFWTAVKTGTSKDMRDNWCLGWSQQYTVGVWVGNSGGASMRDVSGVSGAGPIWHDLMNYLHRHRGSVQAPAPASVSQARVWFEDHIEPARQDFFLGDTAVTQVSLAQDYVQPGQGSPLIKTPADNTILALDPDIPAGHQRVRLQAANVAAGAAAHVAWRVDGRTIGQGGTAHWTPKPGRHRIELLDEQARVLDKVHVDVRGGRLQ
ncbi:penicillin-binding protein 1C [Pusillimonas sp. SM2304]|uniref:penicillin-binding protein 1C n=1 Tax=Pusillimonas sp. SM2304 TaxID=3073241 RepID=UPI002874F522|nr:penicillin-binding protein 1C [Pusillimonas sp. SM2304]MDS1141839.1 penicillin-binding protein 1C [Pusillimonas sp. SM2304]